MRLRLHPARLQHLSLARSRPPPGFRHCIALTLFESEPATGADIDLGPNHCTVAPKNRRNLSALLGDMARIPPQSLPWLGDRRLTITGARRTGTDVSCHSDLGMISDCENQR